MVEFVQSNDAGGSVKTGHVHTTQTDGSDTNDQSAVAGDGLQISGSTKAGDERLDHGSCGRADAIGNGKALTKMK